MAACLALTHAFFHHEFDTEFGYSHAGRAGTVDDDPMIGKFDPRHLHGTDQGRQHHSGRALDVVVECAVVVTVSIQDSGGICRSEILPVNHGIRIPIMGRGEEFVDELVVLLATDPAMTDSEVSIVIEQFHVVGSHVQHDGQNTMRMDSGSRRVHRKFSNGDGNPTDTLITDSKDSLGISDDDEVDLVGIMPHGCQGFLDTIRVVDGQEDAAWPVVPVTVLLDRLADGRRVDDGEHLLDVLAQQSEVQHLVAIMHGGEEQVLAQRIRLSTVLGVDASELVLDVNNL